MSLRMDLLAAPLAAARRAQGELYGMVQMIGGIPQLETAGTAMSSEVVSNSAIEGVDLQLEAVRASMLLRLGAKTLDAPDQIHFEAPGRGRLEKEMNDFLAWFQDPPEDLDGLIRAGLAHLWFITIHPLEDGNGRIARTITDLALAQDEQSGLRFYALSAQIVRRKDAYDDALEQAQRGGLDVTAFVGGFPGEVREAARQGVAEVYRVLARNRFWARAGQYPLNARQIKALRHALSPFNAESVLSNRKYRTITEAIRTTATRDLTQLVELGLLVLSGEKRGATYRVPLETFLPDSVMKIDGAR